MLRIEVCEKISLFRHFSGIFLIFNIFGSTIHGSPDCVRIKRFSLYLDPLVLSLRHRGCGESVDHQQHWFVRFKVSSLLVLSISLTTGSFIFHDTLSIPQVLSFSVSYTITQIGLENFLHQDVLARHTLF